MKQESASFLMRGVSNDYQTGNTELLATTGFDEINPDIAGNYVTWQAFDGNDFEIYRHDSLTGSTVQITDNSKNDMNPQVSDLGYVVWEHEFSSSDMDIYAYDGMTEQIVASSGFNEIDPMLAGNQITWQAFDGDDFEIYTAEIV